MDRLGLATLGGAVVVALLLVLTVGTLVERRRLRRDLAASRADLDALRDRLDDLSRRVAAPGPAQAMPATEDDREFVITSMPDGSLRRDLAVPDPAPVEPVSAGRFASVAVGESVVRLVSLGYGVRRALSEETRHRIRFEMRREVKRSRRRRRRDLKEARRRLRDTGGEHDGLRSDAA